MPVSAEASASKGKLMYGKNPIAKRLPKKIINFFSTTGLGFVPFQTIHPAVRVLHNYQIKT